VLVFSLKGYHSVTAGKSWDKATSPAFNPTRYLTFRQSFLFFSFEKSYAASVIQIRFSLPAVRLRHYGVSYQWL
jgi:hypothetical protein